MTLDETLNILTKIIDTLPQEAGNAMIEKQDAVINLNHEQLLAGKKSDEGSLGTYRPYTIPIRQAKGRQTDHVDLFFEGNFYEGFYIQVNGNEYEINSKDSKSGELEDRYSPQIFGLTPENKLKTWNEFLQPEVVRKLAAEYNLGIVAG